MSNNTQPVNWRNIPKSGGQLPPGQYTVLVRSVDTKPSKKGNPMATLELEIIAPATVEFGGTVCKTAGRKFRHWVSFGENRGAYEDTEKMLAAVLPDGRLDDEVIPEQLPEILKAHLTGKVMSGVELASEENYVTDAFGQKAVDATTGQAIVRGYNIRLKSVTTAVPPAAIGL